MWLIHLSQVATEPWRYIYVEYFSDFLDVDRCNCRYRSWYTCTRLSIPATKCLHQKDNRNGHLHASVECIMLQTGGQLLYHDFVRLPLSNQTLYSLPSNQRAYAGHRMTLQCFTLTFFKFFFRRLATCVRHSSLRTTTRVQGLCDVTWRKPFPQPSPHTEYTKFLSKERLQMGSAASGSMA